MKKHLFTALLVLMLCLSLVINVSAETSAATISSSAAEAGEQVTLCVTLSGARELKSMMIYDISYDSSVLELKSGSWTVADMAISANYRNGVASMALEDNADINGEIFEIVFNVKSSAKKSDTTVSLSLIANYAIPGAADSPVDIGVVSGKITVKGDDSGETESCGHESTETRNFKAATCTEDGYSGDIYCKLCGEKLSEGSVISAPGHTGGVATCHSKAICTRCQTEYGELNPDYHIGGVEYRDAIAATEENGGYSGDKYCLGCGALIEKGHETDKLDHKHNMTHHDAKEANCVSEGNVEYWSCDICGKNYADSNGNTELSNVTVNIDLTNHTGDTELIGAKEATETEEGYTGDTICSQCKTVLKSGEVIAAKGREVTDISGQSDTKPNSQSQSKGNEDISGSETEPSESEDTECAHVMSHHSAIKANCVNGGNVEYWSCQICHGNFADEQGNTALDDVTTPVDSANHIGAVELVGVKEATETEEGYTGDEICSQCKGIIKSGEVIPKLGSSETDSSEGTKKYIVSCDFVSLESENGFDEGVVLEVNTLSDDEVKNIVIDGAEICAVYDLNLSKDGEAFVPSDKVTARIILDEDLRSADNLAVYGIDENGAVKKIDSARDGNALVFESDNVTRLAIVKSDKANADITLSPAVTAAIVFAIVIILLIILLILLKKKKSKKRKYRRP